jgi:hypothetical protein
MRAAEGLTVHSVEQFLSDGEIATLQSSLTRFRQRHPERQFTAGEGGDSVHYLGSLGIGGAEAARIFSPNGRVEIAIGGRELSDARDLLDDAFFRRIEDIRRALPSATWPRGWTYVEYGPGQFCTGHADGSFAGSQVGAGSVRLDRGTVGGEFYVETSGSSELWKSDGELLLPSLYDNPWLQKVPKTRWLSQPQRGTALFWGAHLVHGAQPVHEGVSQKVICWLEAQ